MELEIKPTRMELLNLRQRIKLAQNGLTLLKQKRDTLVAEFFSILGQMKDLRGEVNSKTADAYKAIALAEVLDGTVTVQSAAMGVKKAAGVDLSTRNIMGIMIPRLEHAHVTKKLQDRGYGIIGTSARIDKAAEQFESLLDQILELAEVENAMKKLLKEIERTKQRVNALEFVMIPAMKKKEREISFKMEEMERDSFVKLKVVKKSKDASAAAA